MIRINDCTFMPFASKNFDNYRKFPEKNEMILKKINNLYQL